jgi:hypothetical protein
MAPASLHRCRRTPAGAASICGLRNFQRDSTTGSTVGIGVSRAQNVRYRARTLASWLIANAHGTTVISSGQHDRLVFQGFVRRRHVAAVTADARPGVILAWSFGTGLGS